MEEKRFYPFEHKEEKKRDTVPERRESLLPAEETVQGKGRRGGNAASSRVIHSGKIKETYRHSEKGKDIYRKEKPFSVRDSEELSAGSVLTLAVAENTPNGSFLDAGSGKRILLPFSEQTERPEEGDRVTVTLYEDKGGRLTATMRKPKLSEGETGVLTVAAVTKIGVFVDNGLPKQVLVPFKELLHTPEAGDEILVHIYRDKSGREAGTMRVYRHLEKNSPYAEGDKVEGFVYEINPELGVFVAVDNRYYGMIPASECFQELHYGDRICARVARIRGDGKMDLLLREKLHQSGSSDADKILEVLKKNNGFLPYADKAEAEEIKKTFSMSKNQFKRALGYLYKKRLIMIDREKDTVKLIIQW